MAELRLEQLGSRLQMSQEKKIKRADLPPAVGKTVATRSTRFVIPTQRCSRKTTRT